MMQLEWGVGFYCQVAMVINQVHLHSPLKPCVIYCMIREHIVMVEHNHLEVCMEITYSGNACKIDVCFRFHENIVVR